jgi:hypothetical protein
MIEVRVHIAVEDDNVSVRHLWCCGTLLRGRLMRFMRFSVCVNHGSTLELRTTLTEVARGAKAAAEAGRSCGGIGMFCGTTERRYLSSDFFQQEIRGAAAFGGERGPSEGNKSMNERTKRIVEGEWRSQKMGIKVAP